MSVTRMLGILGTKTSPPPMRAEALDDELDRLLERDPEARHPLVGDREHARRACALKSGITLPRLPTTLP